MVYILNQNSIQPQVDVWSPNPHYEEGWTGVDFHPVNSSQVSELLPLTP